MNYSEEEKEAIKHLDMMENKINFDLLGYVYGNETIDTILNLIQKQDKIIEKMAEYIKDLDLDESICIENTTNPQLCNEQLSNCKECIMEYFKKEVEKECNIKNG